MFKKSPYKIQTTNRLGNAVIYSVLLGFCCAFILFPYTNCSGFSFWLPVAIASGGIGLVYGSFGFKTLRGEKDSSENFEKLYIGGMYFYSMAALIFIMAFMFVGLGSILGDFATSLLGWEAPTSCPETGDTY